MAGREVPERFLVAFSLAGEQRALVEPIVQEVERRLGMSTVFYDEWFEHWLAGSDADIKLQDVYLRKCELAVACISSQYGGKPWTTAEHEAIRARYREATGSPIDRDRVLLVRVGDGEVPGILSTAIVPDIRQRTAVDAAQLIVDRLSLVYSPDAQSENATDWPDRLPKLRWPMADHSDARAAFGELLTRSTEARVLCVAGPSDTGKTHMSRQMLSNCLMMPEVRAGRLDFKGTTAIGQEFDAFVRSLELERPPSSDTLSIQLGAVLSELKRRTTPSVLILDTYEQAGEAKEWVENVLLAEVVRAPWLRVVVLGHVTSMPSRNGAIWESFAVEPIRLTSPGPEDWLAYGREQRPNEEFDLDFVTRAHEMAGGKPTVLAGMLGPR